jgi:predicted metal-dependent enzyme (double-stranded beta helix superfamily)
MFDLETFLADCRTATTNDPGHKAVREVVARAVADPASVLIAIGEPTRAGVTALLRSETLTVLNVVWGPEMSILPHNHRMWAVIGIYTGREDNIFWRRLPGDATSRVEAAGAKSLCVGDCAPLGPDVIHSVLNPIPRLTGAIHVYGGDFFATPRSEWDSETLHERPYDVAKNMRAFELSNLRLTGA